jgi:hypothetical protein
MRKTVHFISSRDPEKFGWETSCGKSRKSVRFVHYLLERVTCAACVEAEEKRKGETK